MTKKSEGYYGWREQLRNNGIVERADGFHDSKLILDHDPMFRRVLGTGVNRRELFQTAAGLAAMSGMLPTPSFAQDKKFDEKVKIGYLPITDAAALLVAHEAGFLKKEGLELRAPHAHPLLGATGRRLRLAPV